MTRNDQLWKQIETSALALITLPDSKPERIRDQRIELDALCMAYAIVEHGRQELIDEYTAIYRTQVLNWAHSIKTAA